MRELPKGWINAELGDLGNYINGRAFKPSEWTDYGLPIIRIQNLNNYNSKYNYSDRMHEDKYRVKNEDLLVAWSASLGVYFWHGGDAWLNQHIFKVIVNTNIVSKEYLFYALRQAVDELYDKAHGTGMVHVTKPVFEKHQIPIPPLNEQNRIVAKLEKLLSKVDSCNERLEKIPAILKRFRQAVLAAACSGKLTEDWREENPDVEPAKNMQTNISCCSDKEHSTINIESERLKIPSSWKCIKSNELFTFVTSGSRGWAKYYSNDGPIFIRVGNLNRECITLDINSIQRVKPPHKSEGARTRVQHNDILISITADVGRVAVIPEGFEEAYINQHVALARPVKGVCVDFIAWFLASSEGGFKQFTQLQRGMTKVGLGLNDIRNIWIPFPPLEEQKEIVRRVEALFTLASKIEERYKKAKTYTDKLTQAILEKAFRGELVPQDPNDEPASVLLEKIKIEKEKIEKTKKTTKPKKR